MLKNDINIYSSPARKKTLLGIYRGVVEDRNDPLRLGRVRVRIWGVHTEEQGGDLNKAPWEELQWAEPIGPNFEGSISGQGAFCVPLQGSHVMVFFENGNMMQPRYFGTAAGFPVDAEKYSQFPYQDGFVDPDQWYPLDDHIDEHDWQRLARVDKLAETYLQIKLDHLDLAVPYAFGAVWDEQPPMYEAEYPDNNVFATHDDFEENIVVELDSTFGKSRFAWWHPSRSYMEINKDGRMTFRNTFHRWDICDGIVHTHYMIDHFKTIDKSLIFLIEDSEWREIKKDRWTKIDGNDWRKVEVDSWEDITGNEICYVGGNRDEIVDGNETYYIAGSLNHGVEGDSTEQTDGNKGSAILGNMIKWVAGDYTITVGGDYRHLVSGVSERLVTGIDDLSVTGDKRTKVGGVSHEFSTDSMVKESGGVISTNGLGGNVIYSQKTVGIQGIEKVNITGGSVHIGNTVVWIGATVHLGVASSVGVLTTPVVPPVAPTSTQPSISTPAEPPTNPAPPAPDIPPDFIPPDVPVEMPEPGC